MRHNKVTVDPKSAMFARDELEAQDVLVQSLLADISMAGSDGGASILPPLVDASRDSEVRLVFLFCPPCKSVVGAIRAYDVSASRPGAAPLLIAGVQRVTDRTTRPPTTRRYDLLLGGDEPGVVARRRGHDVPPVRRIETECAVHGMLGLDVGEAQGRAVQAWVGIRKAEAAGEEPRAARVKLHPNA